ncbi:MAG: cysteine--tRNA ligase, partial [Alphaproteobacteria bacterium]|nr:cysteine--tRNA ligase [Alphaproteobacteria bacterium]
DLAHIGNGRAVVAFDLLYRVLRHTYGEKHVRYVRNITDVEDKIIAAARESGEPIDALTRRTTAEFHADMAALGALPPDIEPRATAYIPQMIALIERLIARQHAYAAEGHVLFGVRSWPSYGKLARRSPEEMLAGARVEVAPYKRDPGDFVLWKPSTPDQPGWDSPWGRGRPGWHIECSAMSESELGETFDIHGGGLDLIFPHHENEIAQSESAHAGHPFARVWMHNEMLTVDGVKMSKSLGNITTVREILAQAPGEAIRLALLMTHYRDPLDWTAQKLHQARQNLQRFYRALNAAPPPDSPLVFRSSDPSDVAPEIFEALEDDLNAPLAIARLHDLARAIYQTKDPEQLVHLQERLLASGRLMGILTSNPAEWLRGGPAEFVALIEQRIAERVQARAERRFAEADRIRAELAEDGVILEDGPQGTTWRTD